MYNNNNFLDMLNALSVIIGLQNLQENREQSRHNDVQIANDEQAVYLLAELSKKFEEQNKLLAEQTAMLEQILHILERTSYEQRKAD